MRAKEILEILTKKMDGIESKLEKVEKAISELATKIIVGSPMEEAIKELEEEAEINDPAPTSVNEEMCESEPYDSCAPKEHETHDHAIEDTDKCSEPVLEAELAEPENPPAEIPESDNSDPGITTLEDFNNPSDSVG